MTFASLSASIPSHWTAVRMTPRGLLCRHSCGYSIWNGTVAAPVYLRADDPALAA